jgi:hypothetical protein
MYYFVYRQEYFLKETGLLNCIVGRATLKMLRRKSKTQFVKQEHNTQNAIAVLNFLKRIAPQQLMLRMHVFTKQNFKAQKTQPQLY